MRKKVLAVVRNSCKYIELGFYLYNIIVLLIILQCECIENRGEKDCQWAAMNAIITGKIGLLYVICMM